MLFDEFDTKMRKYEQELDVCIDKNKYIIVRLDGRNFTKLTKETLDLEVPFDNKFRSYMSETVQHLMNCGFNIVYGYTESDEISLLFALNNNTFNRKTRKILSVLASEASAKMTNLLGQIAVFDSRIIALPDKETVKDYFLWRREDSHRNSLYAHCYWSLRNNGISAQEATTFLNNKSYEEKIELLNTNRINFESVESWKKYGTGIYYQTEIKKGYNPVLKQEELAERKKLLINENLSNLECYIEILDNLI